jgi:hypothetical protein
MAELKAVILGTPDLHVKSGSEIILTCKIPQGPHDLGTVFWYKGVYCDSESFNSNFKFFLIYILCLFSFCIGNNIIESTTNENEIHIEDNPRIMVDTDWADGLTSR